MRRLWHSQAKVLSATQRRGKTSKPRCGNNLCQSISRPSFAHCSAQIRAIFSGGGFGVRCTTSQRSGRVRFQPNPCPDPATLPRATGEKGLAGGTVRILAAALVRLGVGDLGAHDPETLRTKPSVSTRRCVALPASNLLGAVVSARFSSHPGSLCRLRIRYCGTLGRGFRPSLESAGTTRGSCGSTSPTGAKLRLHSLK